MVISTQWTRRLVFAASTTFMMATGQVALANDSGFADDATLGDLWG